VFVLCTRSAEAAFCPRSVYRPAFTRPARRCSRDMGGLGGCDAPALLPLYHRPRVPGSNDPHSARQITPYIRWAFPLTTLVVSSPTDALLGRHRSHRPTSPTTELLFTACAPWLGIIIAPGATGASEADSITPPGVFALLHPRRLLHANASHEHEGGSRALNSATKFEGGTHGYHG
jgi:hypothetical protein